MRLLIGVISYQSLYTQTKLVLGSLGRGSQLLVYSLLLGNPHLESPYLAGQVAKWPGLEADENEDMSSDAQSSLHIPWTCLRGLHCALKSL